MIARSSQALPRFRLTGRLILCLALLLPLTGHAASPRDRHSESDVAVALLYNVTKFVKWPAGSFPSEDSPLRVCTYRSEEYSDSLRELEQRSVRSHPVEVVELQPGATVAEFRCHVLFFTSPGQLVEGRSLQGIEGQAVLTVGSFREFSERGGMLSLSRARKRIELRIDAGVSKRAGLEYSSQLLELATILNRDEGAWTEGRWPGRLGGASTLLAQQAMDRNSGLPQRLPSALRRRESGLDGPSGSPS